METIKQDKILTLGGVEWTVQYLPVHDYQGITIPNEFKIIISTLHSEQHQEIALWHEITHAILYMMGSELYSNEEFVNTFSTFLHQVISDSHIKGL